MKRSTLTISVSACFCLGFATPLLAAGASTTGTVSNRPSGATTATNTPAQACLVDLRTFESQMQKDGYWLGGSGYGYGYPMLGYGYGNRMGGYPAGAATTSAVTPSNAVGPATSGAATAPAASGYWRGRPGYEVRTLIAWANILAQHGQQRPCESVLAMTREIYKRYVADLRQRGMPMANVPGWRQRQIAAAQPVSSKKTSFRSDELVGTDVRNARNEVLGSVDDLVLSPRTGKVAYLVIGRGGIFGIDEKYVPVPWGDFKVTPGMNLLVLDTTKSAMDSAPQVDHDQFSRPGHFGQMTHTVDAYWKAHLSSNSSG